ncbi:hypothetical protein PG990_013848 [Apiospora arundinis]
MFPLAIREEQTFHVEWEERYQQAWIDQVQPNTWVFNWFIVGLFWYVGLPLDVLHGLLDVEALGTHESTHTYRETKAQQAASRVGEERFR